MNPAKELERSMIGCTAGITVAGRPFVAEEGEVFSFPPDKCINFKKCADGRWATLCNKKLSRHNSLFVCNLCQNTLFKEFSLHEIKRPKNLEKDDEKYTTARKKALAFLKAYYLNIFDEALERLVQNG